MQNKSGHSSLQQCFASHCSYKKAQIFHDIRKSLFQQVQGSHPVSTSSLSIPVMVNFLSSFSREPALVPTCSWTPNGLFLCLEQWTYLFLLNLCLSFRCSLTFTFLRMSCFSSLTKLSSPLHTGLPFPLVPVLSLYFSEHAYWMPVFLTRLNFSFPPLLLVMVPRSPSIILVQCITQSLCIG